MSNCEGERPRRIAITTTTGSSAATAPLTLISAVNTATSDIMRTSSRTRLCPAWAINPCPAQAVTPVASRPVLTTNSDAMKITRGIAKSPERFLEIGHSGEIQRERCAEGHQDDRNAVPDEQHHDPGDDGEGERDAAHAACLTCAIVVSCRHETGQPDPPQTMIEYLAAKRQTPNGTPIKYQMMSEYRPHDIQHGGIR